MRQIPAILWYLELTRGSALKDSLVLSGDWRLASFEGGGTAPVEYATVPLHEIDGEQVASYTVQPREMIIGVFYQGARNQRDYYVARRKLVNFVRPNQHTPVRLYVILPSRETVFLEVFPSPGAPLPLPQDRGLTFLEPVNFTAYNPIWQRVEEESGIIDLGSVATIAVPNQAIVEISTETGAVTDNAITVDLSVDSGSGGAHAGFYVEIKKTSEADTEYERFDASASTSYELMGLDDQTSYSIRAIAYNSGGEGTTSSVITQITPQFVPPLAAPDLTFSAGPTSITLTWDAVENATGYRVRSKLATDSDYGDWTDISSTTHTVSSLEVQVSYDFQVEASFLLDDMSTAYGTTAEETISTIQYTPPGPPRNVTASASRTDSDDDSPPYSFRITLSWAPPNTGGPVTSYDWRTSAVGGSSRGSGTTTGTSATGFEDSNRSGSTGTGGGRVRANGPGGSSSWVNA